METRAGGAGGLESFPALMEKLAKAYEQVQSERDTFQAENERLLRRLLATRQASEGPAQAEAEAEPEAGDDDDDDDDDEAADGPPDAPADVVLPVDTRAYEPCGRTLRMCPVHAAPPPREQFSIGDRVEVRDGEGEAWKAGTVVSTQPVKVKPDCWTVDSSATWEMVRPAASGQHQEVRASSRGSSHAPHSSHNDPQGASHAPHSSHNGPQGLSHAPYSSYNGPMQISPPTSEYGRSTAPRGPAEGLPLTYRPSARDTRNGRSAKAIKFYLRTELSQASACLQLPCALMLWMVFAMSVFYHQRIEALHAMDRAVTWDVEENGNFAFSGEIPFENGRMGHKNLHDVNTFADFWSWFDFGLVPLFWADGWDVRESRANIQARCEMPKSAMENFGFDAADMVNVSGSYGRFDLAGDCPANLGVADGRHPKELIGENPRTPTYLYYNSVVGGLRLRQERSKPVDCAAVDQQLQKSVHNGQCLDGDSSSGYWLMPEIRRALSADPSKINRPGGETVYLLSRQSQKEVRQQIHTLENRVWASPMTGKIELLYTTYNSHSDMLTATYIFFFINSAGHFHKVIEPVSIWMHPYHDGWLCYALDGTWIALIFFLVVEEAADIAAHWKQLGCVKGTKVYFRLANCIDWFGVLYSIAMAILWGMHLERLEVLKDYMRQGSVDQIGTWADESIRSAWFDQVQLTVEQQYIFRAVVATYPFVIVSRFFKACAAQPRLSLVTRTMQEAAVDILHFGIVFAAVFLVYAESAMILFGQELASFANTGRSLTSVFRILLGDFDWSEMIQVGRMEAGIWFGSFMVLVNLIMLNMLLAIIMDVYTEVRGSIGSNAKTLSAQTVQVLRRWRAQRRGEVVPLGQILNILDPTHLGDDEDDDDGTAIPDNTHFSVKSLCDIVPGMSEAQAEELLEESRELERQDEGLSNSEIGVKFMELEATQIEMKELLETTLRALQSGRGGHGRHHHRHNPDRGGMTMNF